MNCTFEFILALFPLSRLSVARLGLADLSGGLDGRGIVWGTIDSLKTGSHNSDLRHYSSCYEEPGAHEVRLTLTTVSFRLFETTHSQEQGDGSQGGDSQL